MWYCVSPSNEHEDRSLHFWSSHVSTSTTDLIHALLYENIPLPYFVFSCFAAIKTGRYTHEKKTKNIKEVKQLERARRAAIPPPEAAPDVVALLSKLPLQNKCEKVIEHILAAFQEHAVYTVNFFANIKEKEETYLASLRFRKYKFQSILLLPHLFPL